MIKGGEHYQRMQEHYNFIRESEEFSLIESCVDNGAIEKLQVKKVIKCREN